VVVLEQSHSFKNSLKEIFYPQNQMEVTLLTIFDPKRSKGSIFQVLLLDNDENLAVEVREGKQVDFCQVKEHLKNGGSVFITSKDSQKINFPINKSQLNYNKSRENYGFLFRRQLRSS
jgi:hypothetical protein